jgi:hypothetical protein
MRETVILSAADEEKIFRLRLELAVAPPVRMRRLAAPGGYAHAAVSVRHFGNSTSLSLASIDGSIL